MPPLPDAIVLVLAPFAPLFSHRFWLHAQVLLVGRHSSIVQSFV
jgi:hypothetical protein